MSLLAYEFTGEREREALRISIKQSLIKQFYFNKLKSYKNSFIFYR